MISVLKTVYGGARMRTLKEFTYKGTDFLLCESADYIDGTKSLVIRYVNHPEDDTDLYTTLTCCLGLEHSSKLNDNEYVVKTWSENAPIAAHLLSEGIFEDTQWRVPTGFVEASIFRLV